ncbi:MAG: hypothetical protein R2748_23515 [Bryobacterales bacterium]
MEAQEMILKQMEAYFFGEGGRRPATPDYTPPFGVTLNPTRLAASARSIRPYARANVDTGVQFHGSHPVGEQ